MKMLQGVWKQHLRPRAVVGYGAKIFLPSPPNYVTRSLGCSFSYLHHFCCFLALTEALLRIPQANMRWKVVLTECVPALLKTDRLP